jgi:glycogen phosphorylase/synthase
MNENTLTPDYIFEVSWEICNKVGGINTVVATKAFELVKKFNEKVILIGPDIWREAGDNPTFTEDKSLFSTWKSAALEEGLRVRIGHWDIAGRPIVILVDFSTFVSQKDVIFKTFWEDYRLDSLSGPHDYVEAAMFGYAAGRAIESFWKYYLSLRDKTVAQFHEWMSGTGVLYLHKNAPQIGTLFTTHATVVGRSIAGNGMPLYNNLAQYNGDIKARDLGVISKHSLEKCAALSSDCFTTVSEITAMECEQLLTKKIDVVTPNGFDDSFVPKDKEFETKKIAGRKRLKEVAEALLDQKLSDDVMFVANSGRYEFTNKGIDIFIDSMGKLNHSENLTKEIVAWIMVPANNYGARKDLKDKLEGKDVTPEPSFLTHGLHDSDYDPILNEIKRTGIINSKSDKVKIIFVPSYLDGNDGIFNTKYYDLLLGFDLTIFPSYYEPWGYTPLESIAFHIPTITTNLAGIGMWVKEEQYGSNMGIEVFEREVGKDPVLIDKIINKVIEASNWTKEQKKKASDDAFKISKIALWENLIKHYFDAYSVVLSKIASRADRFINLIQQEQTAISTIERKSNKPIWKNIIVEAHLPEKFKGLDELSRNLWWSWNNDAIDLFETIAPELWVETGHNPIMMLKVVPYERFAELEQDDSFMLNLNSVLNKFGKYLAEGLRTQGPKIAYFSMEYGISDVLKIYSGGLGILAGDYLKEASDSRIDMVGIGLLYKYGYFTQQLSVHGEQLVNYEAQVFSNLPILPVKDENGELITIQIAFPGRTIYARIWKVNVGRIVLYLLDTDFDKNGKEDRKISHQLYGGDNEHRLKQEMLLGIGGIRALKAINIHQDIYHCNEGHAAFIGIERIREFIQEKNFTFDESQEIVRASTLFTTHTPVPAGHDSFSEDLIMVYMGHYPERLKTSWDRFINLGRMHYGDKNERFSMSHLAVNLSQEVNGVSWLHGEVTKDMFIGMWDGYYAQELHIGYVTNGVHLPTWIARPWKELYEKELGKNLLKDQSNRELWENIYKVSDTKIWGIRQEQRKILIDYIKQRITASAAKRHLDPRKIMTVSKSLNKDVLTIGFARRFATYKRAYLLFKDLDRLSKIVNNPDMPVQFLFAGKAHPADGAGQDLIKHIVEISNMPEFVGKITFLPNYDIELAKKLVQGVDIWLNTPTRPLEASGTSGMKAVMNGVMNLSVLDGWWVEGYKKGAGWSLPLEQTYENPDYQDELDAETIYGLLEQEIQPLFYQHRDTNGVPTNWVQYIKKCIAEIAPEFTTKRMIDDYEDRFYQKQYERTKKMRMKDYEMAKNLTWWKKRVVRGWDSIKVVDVTMPETSLKPMVSGEKYNAEIVLNLGKIAEMNVGIEMLITEIKPNNQMVISECKEMNLSRIEGTKAFYQSEITLSQPGVFRYGIRVFPKHPDLPHRMDFSYVKWI